MLLAVTLLLALLASGGGAQIQAPPYGFNASGNVVIGRRLDSFNAKPTATTFNGVPIPRINATPVYVGVDQDNVALYQNENAVDAYWYRVDVYAVVVVAGTAGTIQVKLEYQDGAQVQTNSTVFKTPLDLTSIGNAAYGYICIPMHGSHGIFRYIDGAGVTGSPQVKCNFLVTEF
jgi:hypothetical protein